MKRSTAVLAGAATVALAAGALVASPAMADPIPLATSYADLLDPVPNAMERLASDDANQPAARMELAQYNDGGYNRHHHHHHNQHRNHRWYRANGYNWDGGRWVYRPVRHHYHHHHHHHHHHHNNGY